MGQGSKGALGEYSERYVSTLLGDYTQKDMCDVRIMRICFILSACP